MDFDDTVIGSDHIIEVMLLTLVAGVTTPFRTGEKEVMVT